MMRAMGNRIGPVLLALALLAGALWWWGGSRDPDPVRILDGVIGGDEPLPLAETRHEGWAPDGIAEREQVRDEPAEPETASILVVDGETGMPVPGAEVRFFGDEEQWESGYGRARARGTMKEWDWVELGSLLYTDDEGRFAIDRVGWILARHGDRSGYGEVLGGKRPGGPDPPRRIDTWPERIEIWPETSLTVRVVDAQGRGVAGVGIRALVVKPDGSERGGRADPGQSIGNTDRRGEFHHPYFHTERQRRSSLLGSGDLQVRLTFPGFTFEPRQVPYPLRSSQLLTWTLPDHGSLRAETFAADGSRAELPGTLAFDLFAADRNVGRRTLELRGGVGTLDHLPLGKVLRLAQRSGPYAAFPEWTPGPTVPGEQILLRTELSIEGVLYLGRVLDPSGQPRRTMFRLGQERLTAASFEDGTFALPSSPLPAGDRQVLDLWKRGSKGTVHIPAARSGSIVSLEDVVLRPQVPPTRPVRSLAEIRVLLDGYPFREDFAYQLEGFDPRTGDWGEVGHHKQRAGAEIQLTGRTDLQRFRLGVARGPWFVPMEPLEFAAGAKLTLELSSGATLEMVTVPTLPRDVSRPRLRRLDADEGVPFAWNDHTFFCKGLVPGTYAIEWPPTMHERGFRTVAEVQVPARGTTRAEVDLRPFLLTVGGELDGVQLAVREGETWRFMTWFRNRNLVLGEDVEQVAFLGRGRMPVFAEPRGRVDLDLAPFTGGIQLALVRSTGFGDLLVELQRQSALLPDETELAWTSRGSTQRVPPTGQLELPVDFAGRYTLRVLRMNQPDPLFEQEVVVTDPTAFTPLQVSVPDPAATQLPTRAK